MQFKNLHIIKASGEKVLFSMDKVASSLRRAGANEAVIQEIIQILGDELYEGISTKQIYNRAFNLLKKKHGLVASKYKLKKAIYELGPTGFPFERFIAALLKYSGYHTKVGKILQGKCVKHEVDVVVLKDTEQFLVECKFHGEQGRNCDVKIPLYIDARFKDIANFNQTKIQFKKGWVVTNTRFTADAIAYGKCVNLYLLSWDYPANNSLKQRIDTAGLYPITVSTLLTNREKQFLLSRDVVLCKELINDNFYLDHLGVSAVRKEKILKEMNMLCIGSHH
ncbi:restriction endonuclease [Gillisia sp. M10.2A]|uniref:Restriction endonuclease n=1 Tax=Gillisia lutea TaxID=2909668 RepID=A0ABS9EIN2_9FLAO|nr:restriction endonuclease [Gillisia lutea]MCF4102713.1 restriction endonuclease [Gillisia lutea]